MKAPITTDQLQEEKKKLHKILSKNKDPMQLEEEIITWANNLLLMAGSIQLVPHRDQAGDQVKDPPEDPQGEHQSLGGGSSKIVQDGPHQKLS